MTVYARRPDLVTANLGAELALLDPVTGAYLGLNPSAAHAWRLLATPQSLDALCAATIAEFDVDADTCRTDLTELLDRLVAADLLRIVPDS
jgi:hypothetical protein